MSRSAESLADSFRQSRREFFFMVGIWALFAAWTSVYNGRIVLPAQDPTELNLVFGMPAWVVWGVVLPWALATAATIWFAMAFMKDTDLCGEDDE